MAIPQYGQETAGNGLGIGNKVGKFKYITGGAAVSLSADDSGMTVVIAGGASGASALNLPHINGRDGLEFTFMLSAANGSGDYDIDAKDAASKGAAGDKIHIVSAGGKWWVEGVTNDQDGWAVGTDSANA